MTNTIDILPDSRASNGAGSVVAEFKTACGQVLRATYVPLYCANCGKQCGHVTDNMTFMFYLCPKCFEDYGEIAGTYAVPETAFNEAVGQEMQDGYGRTLTTEEIAYLSDRDKLSSGLRLLERESPYRP